MTHHLVIIYNQILVLEEVWRCEGQGQGRDRKKIVQAIIIFVKQIFSPWSSMGHRALMHCKYLNFCFLLELRPSKISQPCSIDIELGGKVW